MYRLAVRVKGSSKPLMPMKATRVRKFIEAGKAKIRYDRKLKQHYLQLFDFPSGKETQEITIGIDPGSTYDGVSVVSKNYHHLNVELIQRPKKGKTSIHSFKMRQSSNRRVRRSRLRHRPVRFSSRTSNKLTPTIRANLDFRKWLISKLIRLFPISKIVIEDVKFNHYKSKNGRSFSIVEQGKTALYDFIRTIGVDLELYNGFDTKKLRMNAFGGVDLKNQSKDAKTFTAHCLDSFVLACNKFWKSDEETGEIDLEQPIITNDLEVNRKVIFIEKLVKIRRCLTRLRKRYNDGKHYYKKLKNGVKEIYRNFSNKRNVARVKPNGEHSNHPKNWVHLDLGFAERFKCSLAPYGGTTLNGKSFFRNGEWQNRCYA